LKYAVGSLVKARNREWVVLPESQEDFLVVRPLGGTDVEVAGIDPLGVRFWATTTGGALAALGGVFLAMAELDLYSDGMSAGRGFIALAAVIFGRWNPLGAAGAALFFGAFEALQFTLQRSGIPSELMQALPYLAALVALAGFAGRSRPPASDGVPYTPVR